jgi:predicted transcriptional regulator
VPARLAGERGTFFESSSPDATLERAGLHQGSVARRPPELTVTPIVDMMANRSIMPEPTVRERILQALQDLPPDATFDDAIERLVFLATIDAGLAELDAGEGIPHDEVKRRFGL